MKLDPNILRYLSKDDFRVLTAVEMGQKNHEIVPLPLIDSISGLKHGGAYKCLRELLKHKLVHHEGGKYDGYRLTFMGYDFLALRVLLNRGHISGVGRMIGMGKESDIYEVSNDDGEIFALKLHRLGRTSFRAVTSKRDYIGKRTSYSWLYLSRLAAMKEYAFMQALWDNGFPVPQPIDSNRHAVLMTLVEGHTLVQVNKLLNPGQVYLTCMELISRLASKGLIHCDFNEFNLLITQEEELTLIDFPQMVSVSHENAQDMFDRDVECIIKFFTRKIGYSPEHDPALPYVRPSLKDAVANLDEKLDVGLAASGFKKKHQQQLEEFLAQPREDWEEGGEGSSEGSDSGSEGEKGRSGQEEGAGASGHKDGQQRGEPSANGAAAGERQGRGGQGAAGPSQTDAAADLQGDASGATQPNGCETHGDHSTGAADRSAAERAYSSAGSSSSGDLNDSSEDDDGGSDGVLSEGGAHARREALQTRRDELQSRKLESLTRRTHHMSLKERDVQHMVAQQRKKEAKRAEVVKAGRNAAKQAKGKGTRKTKGGGSANAASFAGW